MKAFWAVAAVGLTLMGSIGVSEAQGFREREFRQDREFDGRGRGGGGGGGGGGFDEEEYLRCNADVRRSVRRGQTESGFAHYRTYGRREGRLLTCN